MPATPYPTRKTQYPGNVVIDAEFAAVATPEQMALVASTPGSWSDTDAPNGTWSWYSFKAKGHVLQFSRLTGEVVS
jgi:hypothetical protein